MIDVKERDARWCSGAALVYINGNGRLKKEVTGVIEDGYEGDTVYDLTLNGKKLFVPGRKEKSTSLVKVGEPFCPTCSGILAAGYGREHSDWEEIGKTGEKLNEDFVSLSDSVEKAEPLLGLLEPGMYVIADILAYPTDGNGRFFWDFPEKPGYNPGAADSIYTGYCHCESGLPVFLYPTQGAECLNRERVEYYREKYRTQDEKEKEKIPRAIAYHLCGHISALLDGHHKACAAALEGECVRCLTIMPFQGYTFRAEQERKEWVKDKASFGVIHVDLEDLDEWCREAMENQKEAKKKALKGRHEKTELKNGPLSRREWEEAYKASVYTYPDAEEYGEILAWDFGKTDSITDEEIKETLEDWSMEGQGRKLAMLAVMTSSKDKRLKKFAMDCIMQKKDYGVQKRAFQSLLCRKGDKEIEEFMITYLVEEPIAGDGLRNLAYQYFE